MELQQVLTLKEFDFAKRQEDALFVLSGKIFNEIASELRKGHEARWVLQSVVELGSKDVVRNQG